MKFTGAFKRLSNFKGTDLFVEVPSVSTDPFFSSVSLLLQPSTDELNIIDKSPLNNSLDVRGVTLTNTTEALVGKAIDFRRQSRAAVTISTNLLTMAGGDYTVEGWVYMFFKINPNSSATEYFIDSGRRLLTGRSNSGWGPTGAIGHGLVGDPGIVFSNDYNANEWMHIAFSRNNGVLRMFVNGDLKSSANTTVNHDSGSVLTVGNTPTTASTTFQWNHLINSVRITNGVGRYTTNFTPETEFPTQ